MANKQDTKNFGASPATETTSNASDTAQSPTTENSPVETVKDTAKTVYEQAKSTANQALGAATDKATTKIDEQKTNLSGGLSDVADGLRKAGASLRDSGKQNPVIDSAAKYGDVLARRVEQAANYFDQKDLSEILRDTERFARRNPALFVAGAVIAGFAAARFLKSSNPRQALQLSSQTPTDNQIGENSSAKNSANSSANQQNANQI